MNVSKITNITSGGVKGTDAAKNLDLDKNEQMALEEIKKEIIKRTEHGEYLFDVLSIARDQLKQAGLDNKYYFWTCDNEKYCNSELKTFDELDLNIWRKLIDKFEVYDRYNSRQTMVFLYKAPPEILLFKDLKHFGEKEIPIENIELAYKDVEKLAKAGYGDREFIECIMFHDTNDNDSIPNWPKGCWYILPSDKLCSFQFFGKFGEYSEFEALHIKGLQEKLKQTNNQEEQNKIKTEIEKWRKINKNYKSELEPGFVDKYLKAWKEEMLKVNKLGLDRYRYEKYGRTH